MILFIEEFKKTWEIFKRNLHPAFYFTVISFLLSLGFIVITIVAVWIFLINNVSENNVATIVFIGLLVVLFVFILLFIGSLEIVISGFYGGINDEKKLLEKSLSFFPRFALSLLLYTLLFIPFILVFLIFQFFNINVDLLSLLFLCCFSLFYIFLYVADSNVFYVYVKSLFTKT